MKNKYIKFKNNISYFKCPICSEHSIFNETSIVCKNNHCFDISKKGYINFLNNIKPQEGYNKDFFEKRSQILNDGFYEHIAKSLLEIIKEYNNIKSIIDIGCGDGYYAHIIKSENQNLDIMAFDFSKDAINVASRGINDICFFVGDLGKIPIANNSIDAILNIYTPANYPEFKRILNKDGIIIKVIPGKEHLKEIRELVRDQLKNKEYSNKDVINCFTEHVDIIKTKSSKNTLKVTKDQVDNLISMTPLLFNIDKNKVDFSKINEITIDAEILIGNIK